MTILVFGRQGQVAQALLEAAARRGVAAVALGRAEIDIRDRDAVAAAVRAHAPSVVVNASAYTAVDRAEQEEPEAFALNATAVGHMAEAAAVAGVPFVHYSTDYVFDGTATRPYREDDPTGPVSAYGRSKLAGEILVRERCLQHLILRTSWVVSATGQNFLKTMLRLAKDRDELRIVDDQHGRPTPAGLLADAAIDLTAAAKAGEGWGTYHVAGAGETTWCGFAREIFTAWSDLTGATSPRVVPITTAEFPTPARRPAWSVLDCTKAEQRLGVPLPPWRTTLTEIVGRLQATQGL